MRISKRSRHPRHRGGFTLTELMISVAIIGVLAAIAIPNFLSYQARSRRSEGFTNVAGIARAYKAYHAESGVFPDMLTQTTIPTLPDNPPSTTKMSWDATTENFFKIVGWRPDGNVFYTYEVNSDGCLCTQCFTAIAHGDVDGNGVMGALMYVHPQRDASDAIVGHCSSDVFPAWGPPLRDAVEVYDEVAIRLDVDQY